MHAHPTLSRLGLALLLLLASSGPPQGAGGPSFVRGDLTKFDVRVKEVSPLGDEDLGTILWLEVSNLGSSWASPMAFDVREAHGAQEDSALCLRVPGPHYGRAGDAIDPGAKRTFAVMSPFTPARSKRLEVTVARASFHDGAFELSQDAVRVLSHTSEAAMNPTLGRSTDRTTLRLRNETEHTVGVVLRLELDDRNIEQALVTRRLEPRQEEAWLLTELATPRAFLYDVDVRKAEVLDCSAVLDDGAELAAETLREAWSGLRGPWGELESLGGRFCLSRDAEDGFRSVGDFMLSGAEERDVEPDDGLPAVLRGRVGRAFEDLLEISRLPDVEELMGKVRPTIWSLGQEVILHVPEDPLFGMSGGGFYGLEGGRLRWSCFDGESASTRRVWRSRESEQGWQVVGWDQYQGFQSAPAQSWDLEWQELSGGAVPVRLRHVLDYRTTGKRESTTLELSALVQGAAPLNDGAPPGGPLADALRAGWDASYRYPAEAVTLEGRFEMKTPGDAFWLGRRKLVGTFRYEGFTGTRWSGREILVEESGLGEHDAAYLADCVGDRFLIWFARDPGARGGFDQAFAGATLTGTPEDIAVTGRGPFRGARLWEGRVGACDLGYGAWREYRYRRVGGEFVPQTISTGSEELRMTYKTFGKRWILPVKVEMFRVFSEDWGPETLSLSRVKVRE